MRSVAALSRTSDADLAAVEAADAVGVGLDGPCDLVTVFVTADHADALEAVAAAIETRLEPSVLLGAVAQGVVGPAAEVESGPAVAVWGADVGLGHVHPFRTWAVPGRDGGIAVAGWPDTRPGDLTILLVDPYTYPAAEVVQRIGEARPGHVLIGGLVTGGPGRSRLLLDDRVHDDGAVGVVISSVDAATVVSQGCRPIGAPLTVTAADRNRILSLAGAPAAERLQGLLQQVTPSEREQLRTGGLHLGLVVDELRDDYGTGDFLIRAVLDVDTDDGVVTVGDLVHVGQTVQFHVRDATTADEDLTTRLEGLGPAAGTLLFTCNGRGRHLFDKPDHDVSAVEDRLGGAVAGVFCAGEIGPVGSRSFLHGFTASLAVFRADGA